jgi:hypothetical protein
MDVVNNLDSEIHNEMTCIKILCLKFMLGRPVLRYRVRDP